MTPTSAPKLEPVFSIFVLGATPPPDLLVGSRIRNVLTEQLTWLGDQLAAHARAAPLIYGEAEQPQVRILTAAPGALETLAGEIATEREWLFQRIHTAGRAGPFDPPLLVFDFQSTSQESSPAALRKQALLAFSDVALFYWDPSDASNPEFTSLIRGAILAHMPAIWVGPDRRAWHLDLHRLDETVRTTLLTDEAEGPELARLFVPFDAVLCGAEIRAVIDPIGAARGGPADRDGPSGAADLARYFSSRARGRFGRYAGRIDKAFSALLTGGGVWKALRRDHTTPWYGVSWAELGFEDPVVIEPDAFRRRFEWSDREANVAAGRHRDATWILHILSAFAVFAAVAGAIRLLVRHSSPVWALAELAAIAVIVATVWAGKRFSWHGDWLSHRFVAEQIRYGRMGFPLLVLPDLTLRPATQSDPQRRTRLLNAEQWILKRTLVASGPPRTETGAYRPHASSEQLRPYVCAIIQGQIDYHERTHHRLDTMARRLHLTTVVAFVATAGAVIAHLFVHVEWLLLLTAGLPAFAAALYSISTRNELERLAALSEASARKLRHIKQAIEALEFSARSGARSWLRFRRLAAESTSVMSEVAQQWQQLIQKRSDSLPV